jgi:hypothetical protein
VGCVRTTLDVADLVCVFLVIFFDVKNEAVSRYLIILSKFNDVADVKIFPRSAHESLVPSVEHKLVAVQFVNRVCCLLELLISEYVDARLAKYVDHSHTVDNFPALLLLLRKGHEEYMYQEDKDIESEEGIPEKHNETTKVSLNQIT